MASKVGLALQVPAVALGMLHVWAAALVERCGRTGADCEITEPIRLALAVDNLFVRFGPLVVAAGVVVLPVVVIGLLAFNDWTHRRELTPDQEFRHLRSWWIVSVATYATVAGALAWRNDGGDVPILAALVWAASVSYIVALVYSYAVQNRLHAGGFSTWSGRRVIGLACLLHFFAVLPGVLVPGGVLIESWWLAKRADR